MAITQVDWDTSVGKACSVCGRLSFRLLDGVCMRCHFRKTDKEEKRIERNFRERELRSIFKGRRAAGKKSTSSCRHEQQS
jgi:ribosomal protein L37E